MTRIRQDFREDHVRLEKIFAELLNAVESDDSPTIQRAWGSFEEGLTAHLEAEERHMLPALEHQHPEEVARIRREHAKIRELVGRLGIDADLHLLRKEVAEELVAFLRQHAKREDDHLYKWADEELDAGLVAKLRSLLEKVVGGDGRQGAPASSG